MSNFLFVYHGGKHPENPDDVAKVMQAWNDWFAGLGDSVIDMGAPVGMSSTVNSDGTLTGKGGSNPVSGYSIIQASGLDDVHAKARGCPILSDGGNIEIAEIMEM